MNASMRGRLALTATLLFLCLVALLHGGASQISNIGRVPRRSSVQQRPPASAQEEIVRFAGELSRGQDFRVPVGHGLLLTLGSTGDGWSITVGPGKVEDPECTDYSWVVNAPVRDYNDLILHPAYGLTARDAVERSPREINFVLSCAGYKRESTLMRMLNESVPIGVAPPTEKQLAAAYAKLGTSPQGHGKLWIEDYKISPAPKSIDGKNYGQIDWIRYRLEIRFPENADSLPVPDDYKLPGPPHHTITGTIRNRFTHEPVEGAEVSLAGQGTSIGEHVPAVTSVDGRFRFEEVPEGPVNILVKAAGFIPPSTDTPFTVGTGTNDFDIGIAHLSTIAGRVVDESGNPIQGVFVYFTANQLKQGRKRWTWVSGQAVTASDGKYSFEGLRPGQYVVHTLLRSIANATGLPPVEAYLPQYYPGAADFASAARLELQGQEVRADFKLHVGRSLVSPAVPPACPGSSPLNANSPILPGRSWAGLSMTLPRTSFHS